MVRSSILSALLLGATPVVADTLVVASNAGSGEGSLRAALETAAARDAATVIVLEASGDIQISDTLVYAGTAPLSIVGASQKVVTDRNVTLLTVTNGADLHLRDLTFEGPGGFDITTRDADAAGKGVFISVPTSQTGTVTLSMDDVLVTGVAGHGIHISDCDLVDDCGGGSQASIAVDLKDVTVSDVGNGSFDADGLRVDERGPGDITARIWNSRFVGVGADGVELDEGQAGSVIANVVDSVFDANGIYCDPTVLASFVPDPNEVEFEEGARAVADIPGNVTGAPDNACIEREVDLYDDGSVEAYEFSIDLDDGFDVDEAGPGGIDATLINVTVTGNLDEGLDFDEEDAGSIVLRLDDSILKGNSDDGVKVSEEDDGDVLAALSGVFALSNGGKGIVFEEEDDGDAMIAVLFSTTRNNDDGDDTGIEVDEDDAGEASLILHNSTIADGVDADGIELR